VLDDPQPTVAADLKAPGIVKRLAVIQRSDGVESFEQRGPADTPLVEILIPFEQVPDIREHPAGARALVVRGVQTQAAAAARVRHRPTGDETRFVDVIVGRGHAERREDLLVRIGGERDADRALDDQSQQGIARVRVEVFSSLSKVELRLLRRNPQHRQIVEGFVASPTGNRQQRVVVTQPARVVDQVLNGDTVRIRGQLR
jgi:hypothetical protein